MAEVEECPVKGGDDAREARWFPLDQLPPLAFDHDEIVAAAVARRCGGASTAAYNK
jgi:8-oxo-dGTP diphosphatase